MILIVDSVSAQEIDRSETVAGRFNSILQPEGMPVGAMRLYPRIGVGGLSSDNVFANDDFKKNDWAYVANGELVLRSNTSRFFAEVGARGELERYDDFDQNDSDTSKIWFSGDVDLTRASNLGVDLSYASLTESRTSADLAEGALELTEYNIDELRGRYFYQPSRWSMRLDGRYRVVNYDDVDTLFGRVDNDDRDRDMLDLSARFGYDLDEGYGLFLEGRLNDVEYDQTVDNDGFERSYDGFEALLGSDLKLSGLIVGEFYLGYLYREFDDRRFDKSEGISYGADIDWVITNLITLNFGAKRDTKPTTITGASTVLDSRVSVGVDYEFRRNLILRAGYEFRNLDYEDIPREDDNNIVTFGAEYRINRNFWLTAGYRYYDRDDHSESGGREFTINEYTFQLSYQI
ncbi:MAG: outer membrane beta-barrel protein [Gammaproteobacteria bacterium]